MAATGDGSEAIQLESVARDGGIDKATGGRAANENPWRRIYQQ